MSGRTLVIGADSVLGSALLKRLQLDGREVIGTTRRDNDDQGHIYLELGSKLEKGRFPSDIEVVYLCAAITNIRQCQSEPEKSSAINVDATVATARFFAEQGAFVVFPSTNLVFDGTEPLVSESTNVHPVEEYGKQKAAAEAQILSLNESAAVIRLTKVLDSGFSLFNNWYQALKACQVIAPFKNMYFAPVTLQETIKLMIKVGDARESGIFQFSAAHDISYADAANFLAELTSARQELVKPCNSADVGYEGIPPQNTSLDCRKVAEEFDIHAPDPYQVLDEIYTSMIYRSG